MNAKRLYSLILSVTLALGSISVASADEMQLPSPEAIDSMHLLTPVLKAETEAESEAALQSLADSDANGKLLALAQIAEFAEKQGDLEVLIAFLPYLGEDLRGSLDATTATKILESDVYSDLFKIYVIDLANTLDNFSSASYNKALVDVAMDSSESDELRIYAAHDMDADMVSDPAAIYETLYNDADSMEDKMLMLKDIGFVEPATARELSLDVLDNYEAYESRIVTMANKAYIRSINGEQELIDDIITRNREIMAAGDAELTNGCVLALSELKEPEAVELIFELESFEGVSGLYKLVDYNFDGVTAYTAEAGTASLTKIVEAVPVKEFIPIIESRMAQRSTDALSTEMGADLLNTIEIANSEVSFRTASDSNWSGYAIFRDGVIGNYEYHAGIVYRSTMAGANYITRVAHHPGRNEVATTNGTFSEFLNGNKFLDARKTTTTISTRNRILAVCDDLNIESVNYTAQRLINYTNVGSDMKIHPKNVTQTRCDGYVEYCYEYSGQIIRGSNISTLPGAQNDNSNALGSYTPKHLRSNMDVV